MTRNAKNDEMILLTFSSHDPQMQSLQKRCAVLNLTFVFGISICIIQEISVTKLVWLLLWLGCRYGI
jgi:hypothetical protein